MFDKKVHDKTYYQNHRQEILEYAKDYRQNHQGEIQEYRKAYYQEPAKKLREQRDIWGREYKSDVTYLKSLGARERNFLQKIRVLSNYSNPQGIPICNNCGERDRDVLCLDHLAGGGSKHRRSIGKEGIRFYDWVVQEGFPVGFQVLCYNCNTKKARVRTIVKTGTNN